MTVSYTAGAFVGDYPTTKFRRKDFLIMAELEDVDDLAPKFALKETASKLATGKKTIKSARQDIYDHWDISNEDVANYMVLATTRVLKEAGETSPQMIDRQSEVSMDRSTDTSKMTAEILSNKEMILSDGRRIRMVNERFSTKGYPEHGFGWYLELVGEKEEFEQILLAGEYNIHGG